ncbi:hypothetical protein GCM10023238_23240 [Streptomyces heliomycini]
MAQLARETTVPVQQPSVHDDRGADADLGGHVEEVARGALAEPQFGQRAEVGLVGHGERQARREEVAEVRVEPAEVRGAHDGPGVARHQTRYGHGEPRRPQALGLHLGDDPLRQLGELPEHRSGGAVPVRDVPHRPRPDPSAQVDRADREVVDADLGADPRGAAPADGERRAGTAHASGPLGSQFLQQGPSG